MNYRLPIMGFLAVLLAFFVSDAQTASPQAAAPVDAEAVQGFVSQYCVSCHSQTAREAGLDSARRLTLDDIDPTNIDAHRGEWENVVRRLRAGMMPPQNARQPEGEAVDGMVVWLENELDRTATAFLPPPGLHRLNQTEYANAVEDLLALKIDPADYLPADDSTRGFDNIAGALGLSSTLLESYVSAAGKISRLAVGTAASPRQETYRVPEDTSQDYHVEGLPFGTRGGMLVEHVFPSDGEYQLTVIPIFGDNMSPTRFGTVDGEKLEILLDGERMELIDWTNGGRGDRSGMSVTFPVKAGPHQIGVTFLARNFAPLLDLNRQFERQTIQTGPTPGYTFYPHVGSIRISGPFGALAPKETPVRERIFICRPASGATAADETACAREIVTNLASKAFRREVTDTDLDPLMEFYEMGRDEDFDTGIEMALSMILASSKFIYRMEAVPANLPAGATYRLNDEELASRLSYFLWSTGPDEELRTLASQGRLQDREVLEGQVRRMLADPKAEALTINFAGQWLNLRGIEAHSPIPLVYPNFDDPLRQAMRREVELLFDSIVREDRNVVELLTADYTFVNERLAKHYGIPYVEGSQFRRVTLGDDMDYRRGLLGKGAILTTSSKPERTSPVTRGKWVMTNILGVSPPDPPANVPPLPPRENDARGGAEPTMRQMMEEHRIRPDCVQCHSMMDPIGFALENFDGIAVWRATDSGQTIDPAGRLFDGTMVDGPRQLREWLVSRSDQFVQVVVEKLLTYALGRGVEYQDMPVVRQIVRQAAANDNRFSALVMGVVDSAPFRTNMKMELTSTIASAED
jgi:mono/diheme cytochrome c family protein